MLTPDLADIVTASGDVERQFEREPRHRADRIPRAVLLDLLLAPGQVPVTLGRLVGDDTRWSGLLDGKHADLVRVFFALHGGERN
jgi:hypothetical protein